ncbi:hypothetical protein PV336_16265 [Streptomyces sp. MI02-2A]|uniref:hypothetical protein n=1 Tax=Streptomyces sp. MI02-2A TaxID=3028688 RepID=UPI0029A9568F|nr:hypothetical protein [Streptomyces sp. MI02-2A]MDX3260776.1 hypothetical protein [Streptomyces sp. MI02-2A]
MKRADCTVGMIVTDTRNGAIYKVLGEWGVSIIDGRAVATATDCGARVETVEINADGVKDEWVIHWSHLEPVAVHFTEHEVTPAGDALDRDRARAGLLAEWEDNSTGYPYVTAGMAWEVKRYALVFDVELPDLDDKEAVRAFVETACAD